MEEWFDLKGYEGMYQITKSGLVRKKNRCVDYRTAPYRYLKLNSSSSSGYITVCIIVNGVSKNLLLHRLLAIQFLEPVPGCDCVNHKDGNKLNNNLSNLEWTTLAGNNRHAWETGLMKNMGCNSWRAKLKENDLLNVRSLISKGVKSVNIAKMYNLDPSTISNIKRGKSYKTV